MKKIKSIIPILAACIAPSFSSAQEQPEYVGFQPFGEQQQQAKSKDKKKKKGKSASSKASAESTSEVVANARLVEAIKGFDVAREQAKSFLVEVATVAQEEQCSKAEIVASIVAARGCTEKTAKEQYSRMKKLLTDPEALEELRTGQADLKTVREKTTKKQSNPSPKKAKENAEKKFAKGLSLVVTAAKEQGWDAATVLNTLKAKLKKEGVK